MTVSGLAPPLATFAGGTGSIQIAGADVVCSFQSKLKDGTVMVGSGGKDGLDARTKGIRAWTQQMRTNFSAAAEQEALLPFLAQQAASANGPVRLVMVSAFYYVASEAKLALLKYLKLPAVIRALEALRDNTQAEPKSVANAARLLVVLQMLFHGCYERVELLFARDWELHGKPFRTTWTAGWGIEQLGRLESRLAEQLRLQDKDEQMTQVSSVDDISEYLYDERSAEKVERQQADVLIDAILKAAEDDDESLGGCSPQSLLAFLTFSYPSHPDR